jgi:aminopeptidase-like protein
MDAEADLFAGLRERLLDGSPETVGEALHALASRLYPICRSITGPGVRETLSILSSFIKIEPTEVPTGTEVFDWTIPNEWSIRDAYIADATGRRLVDFKAHTLHVLNYSAPFRGRLMFDELRPHLHSLPDQPDLIPYRTSYYSEKWGFCLSHRQLESLGAGPFEVVVDSTLAPGGLTLGEVVIPGTSDQEILITAHHCHPSLANDNLSGLVVATALAMRAKRKGLKHTLRVLFIPGTIGSIAWLALNEAKTAKIAHGMVLTGLGDRGALTYKQSRRGNAAVDDAAAHVLAHLGPDNKVIPFGPWGYDERQFGSPGFNLPVGRLSRTPHGEYPEYHTSGDNLDLLTPQGLAGSLAALEEIIAVIEGDATYRSTNPKGEPRLGKRGLYRQTAGQGGAIPDEYALLWVLNQADGEHSLLDTAKRSGLRFGQIRSAADALLGVGLLEPASS